MDIIPEEFHHPGQVLGTGQADSLVRKDAPAIGYDETNRETVRRITNTMGSLHMPATSTTREER